MNIFNAIFKTLLLVVLCTALYYFVQFYHVYTNVNKYTYISKQGSLDYRVNNTTDSMEFFNKDKVSDIFKFMTESEYNKQQEQFKSDY